jgi:hypothetical protein
MATSEPLMRSARNPGHSLELPVGTKQIGWLMTPPQQPPPPQDNWEEQPLPAAAGFPPYGPAQISEPAVQDPQVGYTAPVLAGGMISRKRRWAWIGAVAVLVLSAGGLFLLHSARSQVKGHLVLPRSLLGLRKDTSADARQAADMLKRREMQSDQPGSMKGVVAAIYGSPFGALLTVSGGSLCQTCMPLLASRLKSAMVASGDANVRIVPAGPNGGAMACGTHPSPRSEVIRCTWADDRTAGDILYVGGSAKGLRDAAAESITIRAAAEH